jgi:replicative DNA helicase
MAMADIKAEATRLKRRFNIGALFIDQLNWINLPKKVSREEGIGVVTRGLRRMAQDLDLAVIIAHQLNRDVEKRGGDKRPQLSDLRDSGNIEQDIQVAMFLYRPEYYKILEFEHGSTLGLMEVIVAKNSNGPLGSTHLRFQGHTASVHDDFFSVLSSPLQHFSECLNYFVDSCCINKVYFDSRSIKGNVHIEWLQNRCS